MYFRQKDVPMDQLLERSIELIQNKPTLRSDEAPLDLLSFWCYDGDPNQIEENDHQWEVFLFALINYNRIKGIDNFQLNIDELIKVFNDWQVLINTAMIPHLYPAKIESFPLLDFDNFENVKFEITFL